MAERTQKLNWPLAIVVFLVGCAVTGFGVWVADDADSAWSSVWINVGVALGLVAVVVVIERRITTRVERAAETTARKVVTDETKDLRARVDALEELDERQAQERERRREAATAAIDRVAEEVTIQSFGDLLRAGQDEQLFDGGSYRFRTSARPDSHELYSFVLVDASGVTFLWLGFDHLICDTEIQIGNERHLVPGNNGQTVLWHEEPASEVAVELEDCLRRKNEPLNDFSLAFAVRQVSEGLRIMRAARDAPAGDPLRLQGNLRLLINDEWAVTSHGLESLSTGRSYRFVSFPFGRPVALGSSGGAYLDIDELPAEDELWEEAVAWAQDQERWAIRWPGEREPD